jgi:hypothetical protein
LLQSSRSSVNLEIDRVTGHIIRGIVPPHQGLNEVDLIPNTGSELTLRQRLGTAGMASGWLGIKRNDGVQGESLLYFILRSNAATLSWLLLFPLIPDS